jgi:hypothetical protein
MKLHRRAVMAASVSVIALVCGSGVAQADPIPTPPPLPPAIDLLVPLNPSLWIDPDDEGGPSGVQGDYGRFCENAWVHCR